MRQLSDGRQLQDLLLIFSRAKSSASPARWAPDAMCWSTSLYGLRSAERGTIHLEGHGRGASVRQSEAIAPARRAGAARPPPSGADPPSPPPIY
ncbi:hypothetical protein LN650_23400 [Klebsiella pneumoniae subsp. pneumoniae]|nr:hypothetical protein [Klebsiella pneumoniae subsp. pneumoniae]